jgi:hypothetical protein
MATAILKFDLTDPDDEREHRYALAGRDALLALHELQDAIRRKRKCLELSQETRGILEELQQSIPLELVELLN